MALPPGFLDELRDRVSIAQIVGRKVSWDMRKSNQSKGDWWAPCPFHQEKTASFHVEDQKGYYYCFGCHAKGDAITFLREQDGLSFMEAVEELARTAGMEMPAPDPRAAAQATARATLTDVMECAVRYFRRQLGTQDGAGARAYLSQQRGLSAQALDRFEIGFAPPGWDGLRDALTKGDADIDLLLATGLVRPSDKGRAPYDTFRNRIIFPIRDARGRAIAFGGRAMDPEDNAKYLNSPDTELFDKGRTLYHHRPARAACGKGAALIVAEGYMDVIALAEAGFDGAVAPLGTAVTEAQLKMLWQIHPEPLVALDGDAAGLRAGYRLMDLALPLIEAGQSLRFALLPAGKDPDDVIRAGGPEAMQALLDNAVPMVDLLWRRATEGRVLDSPERRAALEKDLRRAIAQIADPGIRSHYGHAIRDKRAALFQLGRPASAARPGRPGPGRGKRWAAPAGPAPETRAAAAAAADTPAEHLREAVILATLMANPGLIEQFADLLEETDFTAPNHAAIAAALLDCDVLAAPEALWAQLETRLGRAPLETLMRPRHVRLSPGIRRAGEPEIAAACLASEFARLDAARGAAREIAEAIEDVTRADSGGAEWEGYGLPGEHAAPMALAEDGMPFSSAHDGAVSDGAADAGAWDADDGPWSYDGDSDPPDAITWRLAEATRAQRAAERVTDAARAEFDVADNGAKLDRAERDAFSQLLQSIGHDGAAREDGTLPAPDAGSPKAPLSRKD
ncbi:MAG: DNA primase [Pseudomonadota bacterium]